MNNLLLLAVGVAVGARFDTEVKEIVPILQRPEEKEIAAEVATLSSLAEETSNVGPMV